jgi:hypothetical protein
MAAKPRKSAVQNIIKNLLEMEIPEIQTASKELADWIKQLEQHSFKLQHYATEIGDWAAEEEEADSIELTDLIKDLEATLTDMRTNRVPGSTTVEELEEGEEAPDRLSRGYHKAGRVIRESKLLPKAEIKPGEAAPPVRQVAAARPAAAAKPTIEEPKKEPVRTPQGVLIAKDTEKPRAKAELPTGEKEVAKRETQKPAPEEEESRGYMTPEGFLIRRLRP